MLRILHSFVHLFFIFIFFVDRSLRSIMDRLTTVFVEQPIFVQVWLETN